MSRRQGQSTQFPPYCGSCLYEAINRLNILFPRKAKAQPDQPRSNDDLRAHAVTGGIRIRPVRILSIKSRTPAERRKSKHLSPQLRYSNYKEDVQNYEFGLWDLLNFTRYRSFKFLSEIILQNHA